MKSQLVEAIKYWDHIAPIVKRPKNDKELKDLVNELDQLLEIVGNDENHRLIGLVNVISNLISSYEEENFSIARVKGIDALRFLITAHHLNQSDLPEIASQGVISQILHGERVLNF